MRLDRFVKPPRYPLTEPWGISIADIAQSTGKVPKFALKALGLFDRFGAVRMSPDRVGFDNDDVDWTRVTELRTRRASDLVTGRALEHEVDRIRGYLPPVPGRKWAVERVVSLLLDVTVAFSGDKTAGLADGKGTDDGRVVADVVYQGAIRAGKEMRAGLFATAVLAQVPGVDQCLRNTATARGIPVVEATDDQHFDNALERGENLRARVTGTGERIGAVVARLRGRGESGEDPPR